MVRKEVIHKGSHTFKKKLLIPLEVVDFGSSLSSLWQPRSGILGLGSFSSLGLETDSVVERSEVGSGAELGALRVSEVGYEVEGVDGERLLAPLLLSWGEELTVYSLWPL